MHIRPLRLAGLVLALILQSSPIPLHAWQLGSAGLEAVPLPAGLSAVVQERQADLDGDGLEESLEVSAATARILSGSQTAWASPNGWAVVQALITDLDHDGEPEVTLLVWRAFQPWPIDRWLPNGGRIEGFHDAAGRSCHVILIHWDQGRYHELWAGSAMADPVKILAAADLDGDGRQEIVSLESRYTLPRSAPGTAVKVWEWNGFGFSLVSTLEGPFAAMSLAGTAEGPVLILVH